MVYQKYNQSQITKARKNDNETWLGLHRLPKESLRTVPGEPGIYFLRLHVKLNSMDNREGVVSSIGEKRHGETSNRQGRLPSALPFNIVIS